MWTLWAFKLSEHQSFATAYHDSCSCSGTSICMSKMRRRIYSSPSARFSYEKVSISWNPFPVCLCLTSAFDFSRQKARRKQQTSKCHQLDSHMERCQSIGTWNPFPVRLCVTSGFEFSRQNARRKQQQNATPLKETCHRTPPRSLCIETKKLER